jgi:ubiquinone biosynthesis protein Coq4
MALKYWLGIEATRGLMRDPLNPVYVGKFLDATADTGLIRQGYEKLVAGLSPEDVVRLRQLTCAPLEEQALLALPESSFGHRYAVFMRQQGFPLNSDYVLYPPVEDLLKRNWLMRRVRRLHDMLHLLLDFDTSTPDEMGLLVFQLANFREPYGVVTITGVPFVMLQYGRSLETVRAMRRGWKLACQVPNMFTVPLEDLLSLDLGEVRRRLGIPSAQSMGNQLHGKV